VKQKSKEEILAKKALYRRRWYHKLSLKKKQKHIRNETIKTRTRKNTKLFIKISVPYIYTPKVRIGMIFVSSLKRLALLAQDNHGYAPKEPILVYFVKLSNASETLYKVGVTKYDIKTRFLGNPYEVEQLAGATMPANAALAFESMFIFRFAKYSKRPIHHFGGATECFSKDLHKEFMTLLPSKVTLS